MRLSRYLLPAFILASFFPRLLDFPPPFHQLQLTELLFPVLLLVYAKAVTRQFMRYPLIALSVGCYVAVNVLSALISGSGAAFMEAMGRSYLAVLAFVVPAHKMVHPDQRITAWWVWGTIATALLGLIVYGLILAGGPHLFNWVAYFPDYPYFGEVFRLRATAHTYGMWLMLLLPGFVFAYARWRRGQASMWPVIFVGLAVVPTLSKELLLLPTGILLYEACLGPWRYVAAAGLIALLYFGTHYLFIGPRSTVSGPAYTFGDTVAEFGEVKIVESVYVPIKRAALRVGARHPWLGIGPGRFAFPSEIVPADRYIPPNFGPVDPHSAWTGAFAETGGLGLVSLILVVAALLHAAPNSLGSVAVVLLLFLIASVFKDVMNFRGLWVLVGMLIAESGKNLSVHQRVDQSF